MPEPVTNQSYGASFISAISSLLQNSTVGLTNQYGAASSLSYDASVQTIWFRWIPAVTGSFYGYAENEGTNIFSPGIGLYKYHDPTRLQLIARSGGEDGVASLNLSGLGAIQAGGQYTVVFDKILRGRANYRWSQDGGVLEQAPTPTFSIEGEVMTIEPGVDSPSDVVLYFRLKNTDLQYGWQRYIQPFKLYQSTYTVEARATAVGFLPSEIAEQAVSI